MSVYTDKKSGRFYIQFDFQGDTKKRRLPESFTKSDAEKLEIKWKHDLIFESFGIEKKSEIVFEQFLIKYFLPFAKSHYSPDGYKNVKVICAELLPFLKGRPLRRISVAEIEQFKTHRQNLPTKHNKVRQPATIHRELNIVSKIFSQAVKHSFLDYNPCSRVERPRYANLQDKILPFDKYQVFLDNFNSDWARDVTILILNTGLRQRDALSLSKFNVDFENRIISLVQGKSKRRVEIPMNETVFRLLESRRGNRSELFFPSPKTGKQGTSIKKAIQAATDKSNLGKIGTRVLRRTFGTRLAEMNFNPSTVAKLLGHSNLQSIHRYERETVILREAVKALDEGEITKILPATETENRKLLKIVT